LNEIDSAKNNPVGNLLEFIQKLSLRPPIFEYGEEEDGLEHNKKFNCMATFEEFNEFGHGRSKKLAKRHAALKLLTKLKSSTKYQELENLANNYTTKNTPSQAHHSNAKDKHKKANTVNYFTQMKQSTNPSIIKLLNSEENLLVFNKQLLESLSQEEHFEYNIFLVQNLPKESEFTF
jgi:hypothetical protein